MRAKFINEKFTEKFDPIEDMGIGLIPAIKKALQSVVDKYGLDTSVDEFFDDFYIGCSIYYEKGGMGAYYSITYSENGLEANFTNNKYPDSHSVQCDTIKEAAELIKEWLEDAKENW